jgi:hypothetical protein
MSGRAQRGFHRTELLLWLGVVAGVAMTLVGVLVQPGASGDGELQAAALVDGVPITLERFEDRVNALAKEERAPRLDREQRARMLDELVAEELLLAHALRLDMARANPMVRKLLLESMLDLASALGGKESASEDELRREYEAERHRFTAPRRYRVDTHFFRDAMPNAAERAEAAARKLREGVAWADLRSLADKPTTALPPGALEQSELRTYVGPTAAAAVARMKRGDHAGPMRIAGGHLLVQLVEIVDPPPPAFEKMRSAVEDRWRRKRRAERVRAYVETLRSRAEVQTNSAVLEPSAEPR